MTPDRAALILEARKWLDSNPRDASGFMLVYRLQAALAQDEPQPVASEPWRHGLGADFIPPA